MSELIIDAPATEAAGIVFQSSGVRQFEVYRQPGNQNYGIYDSASGLAVLDHEPATHTTSLQYGNEGYALALRPNKVGFFGTAPVSRPVVSGSWSDGSAAQSVLAALVALGLVTDETTA